MVSCFSHAVLLLEAQHPRWVVAVGSQRISRLKRRESCGSAGGTCWTHANRRRKGRRRGITRASRREWNIISAMNWWVLEWEWDPSSILSSGWPRPLLATWEHILEQEQEQTVVSWTAPSGTELNRLKQRQGVDLVVV
ncbi:hypothetical protein V6N12_011260 [Hibiscus sabdariffa]|uniref:Uncharacterized protein n=1 Tax=Hibiscus sabdariffa TaxID=183260 RepID=A0ABR2EPX9_9ROSI